MFEEDVMWFMESVCWMKEDDFNALLNGRSPLLKPSLLDVYTGFAKHVSGLSHLEHHLWDNVVGHYALEFWGQDWLPVGQELVEQVNKIVSARRRMNIDPARERCFKVGAKISATAY
jgi:hypothetical protein